MCVASLNLLQYQKAQFAYLPREYIATCIFNILFNICILVLQDPMSGLRVSPPPVRSTRANRAVSDRPELAQDQSSLQKHKGKDNIIRAHRTIH